jgi:hypothetical protein
MQPPFIGAGTGSRLDRKAEVSQNLREAERAP